MIYSIYGGDHGSWKLTTCLAEPTTTNYMYPFSANKIYMSDC